jgi:hypothetical protein
MSDVKIMYEVVSLLNPTNTHPQAVPPLTTTNTIQPQSCPITTAIDTDVNTFVHNNNPKNEKNNNDDDDENNLKRFMESVGGGRLSCPRGMRDLHPNQMRDLHPNQMRVRDRAMAAIRSVFKTHGAAEIETPAMERYEVLLGQYGDSQKLVYRLWEEAENTEKLALRYDLTVPMARYMAQNGLKHLKRYQIGPVWRRDHPGPGRFRQFYQCDFDIVGFNQKKKSKEKKI